MQRGGDRVESMRLARRLSILSVCLVAMSGLAGVAVGAVATSGSANLGPGEFIPLDEPTARTMLAELQLAD